MTERFDRRHALGIIGAAGLGMVVTACGDGDDGGPDRSAGPTTTPTRAPASGSTTVSTTRGLDEAGSCTLSPELTEGPFHLDTGSVRSDVREGRAGTDLRLELRVRDAGTCSAIPGAVVDIWHCDADGNYSGFDGGAGESSTFLRGTQVTNSEGIVEFLTVYPGWYPGRTVHIHAKVYLTSGTLLTTQLFFDESVTASVYAADPYARRADRGVFNDDDSIFDDRLVLTLARRDVGYTGRLNLDVAST